MWLAAQQVRDSLHGGGQNHHSVLQGALHSGDPRRRACLPTASSRADSPANWIPPLDSFALRLCRTSFVPQTVPLETRRSSPTQSCKMYAYSIPLPMCWITCPWMNKIRPVPSLSLDHPPLPVLFHGTRARRGCGCKTSVARTDSVSPAATDRAFLLTRGWPDKGTSNLMWGFDVSGLINVLCKETRIRN